MKLNNRKGFTLAELLVVVAIIAVLVAVSIPIFTSKLEKAREATDIANMRAAKAAAVTTYLTNDKTDTTVTWSTTDDGFTAYYNAVDGKLQTGVPDAYGKGTSSEGDAKNTFMGYKPSGVDYRTLKIYVTVAANGNVTEDWK